MTFDNRELGAILCGLRLLQRQTHLKLELEDILTDGGEHSRLDNDEIDKLCEELNCGGNQEDPLLQPGLYSVFVLVDNETWTQPTYKITEPMKESEFRAIAEREHGGFISYGVGDDSDCPERNVRKLPVTKE